MATTTLSPTSHQLLQAWELFRSRWWTAVRVGLIPVIPLIVALLLLARTTGARTGITPTTSAAVIVFTVFYVATIPTRAGLFNLFARREHLGVREAFRLGLRRFWPFLWTELLLVFSIVLSLIPLLAFQSWFTAAGRSQVLAASGAMLTNTVALLGVLLLSVPPVLLAVALSFAPLAAALEDGRGGIGALRRSFALVRSPSIFRKVAGRIILWIVLFIVICTAVEPFPFVQWIMPFVMALIGAAFLTVLYQELKAHSA